MKKFIEITEEQYKKVLEFVKDKHHGQIRRSGEPVINHPIGVAELLKSKGYGVDFQVVALLHDVIEDTDVTEEDLYELGLPLPIIKGVVSLTKYDRMTLEQSIQLAINNEYGKVIKGADRLQNAMTTYQDKNSQEFISGFIVKSMVYYLPQLSENVFKDDLIIELKRLYTYLEEHPKFWVDEQLKEKSIENILTK